MNVNPPTVAADAAANRTALEDVPPPWAVQMQANIVRVLRDDRAQMEANMNNGLRDDMNSLRADMNNNINGLRTDMNSLRADMNNNINNLNNRIDNGFNVVKKGISDLDGRIDRANHRIVILLTTLSNRIHDLRAYFRDRINNLEAYLKNRFKDVKEDFDGLRAYVKEQLSDVKKRIERVEDKLEEEQDHAEGMDEVELSMKQRFNDACARIVNQFNNVNNRILNGSITEAADAIAIITNDDGEKPDDFPTTHQHFQLLSDLNVTELSEFYGLLPLEPDTDARKVRLRRHLGIRAL